VIAVDNDAPGQFLQAELVRRFGPEKCLIAAWPDGCKDANDVLIQHGPEVLRKHIEAAEPVPIVGVFGAEDFADGFLRMYDEGVPNGVTTGWDCMDQNWRVRAGQLVVVTGIPGHGKSEWVDALCMNLAQDHGWGTAMYSPENYPVELHMMKLAEKYIGKPYNPGPHPRMDRNEAVKAKDWIRQHFHWVMPEKPSLDEIMDKARALVFRKGIRCLVIDPWNEVEHSRPQGMTEADYVSESLRRLRQFARKHELLTIVVAHPKLLEKKADGTYPVPTPYDISGGAMWRNKADNCIAVYADPTDPNGAIEIHVQKVKFKLFGHVGMVPMRWDRVTGRYYPRLTNGSKW
jgi:twinkle protein